MKYDYLEEIYSSTLINANTFFSDPICIPGKSQNNPKYGLKSTFPISNYRGDSSVVSACVTSVVESDPQE